MKVPKIKENPDALNAWVDGRAVHERLVQTVGERARRDGRAAGDVRRTLARAIRGAGLKWDTISKKLRGQRRMTEDDLRQIAAAIAENPEWLRTGRGLHGEDWVRVHIETIARRQGIRLAPRQELRDRPILTSPKRRGRPRRANVGRPVLGRRVTGAPTDTGARRGPYQREYKTVSEGLTDREDCVRWLAGNPDVVNEWVGQELDREEPQETALRLLLDAANRAVVVARDQDTAANCRALVSEINAVLDHLAGSR